MKKIIPLIITGILLAGNLFAQKINAKITDSVNITCMGDSNGSAAVQGIGGYTPYTYLWEPGGQTTDTATGLAAGTYTATIIDTASDTAEAIATIGTAAPPIVVATSSSEPSCFGMNNGAVAVTSITGGTAPFLIEWLPIMNPNDTVTGLPASTYTAQVTDANGCQAQTPVPVSQPTPLVLTSQVLANMAQLFANGGVPPYTYSWMPPVSTSSYATGLSPGTYTVTVNDSNLCSSSMLVTIDSSIITFSISNFWVDCYGGFVEFDIMASSSPPTYFNSAMIDIKYIGAEFAGDSVTSNATTGNIGVERFIYPYPLIVTNLSDTVIQIIMSDTSNTPPNETLLDSVPIQILGVSFQIQNPCQQGTVGFTNQLYTGPTCYHTLFAKVFDYIQTDSTYLGDSLCCPYSCTYPCNPYPCHPYQCDPYPCYSSDSTLDSTCYLTCYDTCYNTCTGTCYDTFEFYSYTHDSIFTTYYKNFQYSTAIYSGSTYSDTGVCPPSIYDFNTPIDAGVGDILTISGANFGSTRGTGRVEFYDADTANYWIKDMNDIDYISWTASEIKVRLPGFVDSIFANKTKTLTIGGGPFKVVNSCGDSAISDTTFSVFYNIGQTWNPSDTPSQKTEILLRNTDTSGGYVIRFDSITFPKGSYQRLLYQKAMQEWTCYTGMNWTIGKDTSFNYIFGHYPGVNYVFFADSLTAHYSALTIRAPSECFDSINVLLGAVTFFNSKVHFVYDSTGTVAIGPDTVDFYGQCLHELGHFIGLGHTTSPTDLMFYTANDGYLLPAQREDLAKAIALSAVKGGLYSVNQSASILSICSNLSAMIPLPRTCVNTTVVEEVQQNNTFVVYPNPSNGTFTIESSINDYNLVVMNMLGQVILSRKVQNQKETIDISTVANGMYFIQEQYKNGIATQKLIITKK